MSAFPPIEDLLPHRNNMLLLARILAADDETSTCEAFPNAEAWYAQADGTMPAWIGIELMAQTIAAHVALLARSSRRPPRPGVLLGTRFYKAEVDRFPAGRPLQIATRLTYRDATGLGAYDGMIVDDHGARLAAAAITVYEPEDFAQFINNQKHGKKR